MVQTVYGLTASVRQGDVQSAAVDVPCLSEAMIALVGQNGGLHFQSVNAIGIQGDAVRALIAFGEK